MAVTEGFVLDTELEPQTMVTPHLLPLPRSFFLLTAGPTIIKPQRLSQSAVQEKGEGILLSALSAHIMPWHAHRCKTRWNTRKTSAQHINGITQCNGDVIWSCNELSWTMEQIWSSVSAVGDKLGTKRPPHGATGDATSHHSGTNTSKSR